MSNKAEIVITALDKASAVINRISDRFDKMGEPLARVGKAVGNVQAAVGRLGNSSGVTQLGTSIGNVGERVGNLATKFRNVAAIGIGAVVGLGYAFQRLEGQMGDFSDQLANAGIRGAAVANMRAQADAMGFMGVKSEDAGAALVKLTQNQSSALAGNKTMVAAFQAAGISLSQLRQLKPDQLFEQLANNFSKSEKSGAKLNVATTLMGKSSTKMVEAMSQGPEAFQKFKDRYQEALLTEKDFADMDAAGDRMDGLGLLFGRIGQKLAAVAAPKLTPILEKLESKLLVALPGIIEQFAALLDNINEQNVSDFLSSVASAFSTVASIFSGLHSVLGTTGMVFAGLAVIFGPTIVAVVSLVGSLGPLFAALFKIGMFAIPLVMKAFSLLSALVVANPIVAAVALIIAGVVLLYNKFESVRNVIDGIGNKVATLWESMPSWLGGGTVNVNPQSAATSAAPSAAATIAGGQGGRTDVGGRIVVEVTDDRTKVKQVSSNNKNVPIDVNAGLTGYG